jgi:ribosomal protein L37AE/L43A
MPTKPDAEEAQVNAELAAAHAEKAAEEAAKAERELAEATKEDSKAKLCPACNGELVKHGDANPYKAGAYHCNDCGTCWAPGLKAPR